MRSFRLLFLLAGLGLGVAGCRSATGTNSVDDTTVVTATVRFFQIEGGFYALRTDQNVVYDPTKLASSFQHDGLRVRARVRFRDDLVSFHAVGRIVDVLQIEALSK
jgi:hypothetical protein